jgi:hypothetical protein
MSHWRDVHRRGNPDFLFAEDLGSPGTAVVVQLAAILPRAKMRAAGSNTGEMPACTFVGKGPKKLGLNRTNCKVLETLTGTSEVERWAGTWVVLTVVRTSYPDQVTHTKMETDAIRIAPDRPSAQQIAEAEQRRGPAGGRAAGKAASRAGDSALTAEEIAEHERIEREERRQ